MQRGWTLADVGISRECAWSAVSWRGCPGKDRFYGTNLFVCLARHPSIHSPSLQLSIHPPSLPASIHPSIHAYIFGTCYMVGREQKRLFQRVKPTSVRTSCHDLPCVTSQRALFWLRKQKEAKGGLFQFLCGDHRQNIATLSFENISTVDFSTIKVLLKTRSHSPDSLAFHLLLRACNSLYRVC